MDAKRRCNTYKVGHLNITQVRFTMATQEGALQEKINPMPADSCGQKTILLRGLYNKLYISLMVGDRYRNIIYHCVHH